MKILEFPNYITINSDKELSRNTTGYGYMTIDIATSIAKQGIEVDLLTQSYFTKGKKYKEVNILKRTWNDFFLNIKFRHILKAIKMIVKDKIPIKRMPYIFLYNLSMGYFEKALKLNNYELVHIHGIGYNTIPIIETCKKYNTKYLITLHGLISFSDSVQLSKEGKQKEKALIQSAEKYHTPVSVISTGIRKVILDYLKITDSKIFFVIPNGCDIKADKISEQVNIRTKHNIGSEKKILLCVGNIGKRKNQIQIVNAFARLPETKKQELVVLFLGGDTTNGRLNQTISNFGLETSLITCGNIPRDIVHAYYSQADYNIVASISEGFGLSMIEGFVYGLPTITFSDLDAVPDLYNDDVMILVDERTDETLAEGISKMIDIKWNRDLIKIHAKRFSLDEMAVKYVDLMKKIIS